MDAQLSPFAMVMVALPIVGVLWLATGALRRTHRRLFASVLRSFVMACAAGALVGFGVKAPKVFIDWLLSFGFALVAFDVLLFFGTQAQVEADKEKERLAEIDDTLKKMRDGTM